MRHAQSRRADGAGAGQFPIVFGYSFLSDTYPDVSCMYPGGYMYLECILMRCISNVSDKPCYISREYMYLDILHVFHTYPKRVQDTFWDTHQIHHDTCILDASLVSHWIHVRIHQDTCILDSSSRYITIHQDTYAGYIWDTLSEILTS